MSESRSKNAQNAAAQDDMRQHTEAEAEEPETEEARTYRECIPGTRPKADSSRSVSPLGQRWATPGRPTRHAGSRAAAHSPAR